jgi:hypothetical protein
MNLTRGLGTGGGGGAVMPEDMQRLLNPLNMKKGGAVKKNKKFF